MENKTAFSQFRKNSTLTLNAVAAIFGVNRKTILRWERGDPPVPIKRLSEIEKMTGIPRSKLRPDVFGKKERADVSLGDAE